MWGLVHCTPTSYHSHPHTSTHPHPSPLTPAPHHPSPLRLHPSPLTPHPSPPSPITLHPSPLTLHPHHSHSTPHPSHPTPHHSHSTPLLPTAQSLTYTQAIVVVSLICGILLLLNLILCPLAVVLALVKRRRVQRAKEVAQARKELLAKQESWFQENEDEQLVPPSGKEEEDPSIKQELTEKS